MYTYQPTSHYSDSNTVYVCNTKCMYSIQPIPKTYAIRCRYHPFSIQGMQWVTPIFASNTRYSETMINVDKGTWWNRKKVYVNTKDLNEARTKLESQNSCEEDGNCWRQVCVCVCVCVQGMCFCACMFM